MYDMHAAIVRYVHVRDYQRMIVTQRVLAYRATTGTQPPTRHSYWLPTRTVQEMTERIFPRRDPPTIRELATELWERESDAESVSTFVSDTSSYEASVRLAAASTRMDSDESGHSSDDDDSAAMTPRPEVADMHV